MSASDDLTMKCWDVSTGQSLMTAKGHSDYVRAGVINSREETQWVTGGYDGVVHVWDTRKGFDSAVMTLKHEDPVESVLLYNNCLATAGGSGLKIWDLSAGKLSNQISSLQKPIVCLSVNKRSTHMLTGSLDHHVKIFDTTHFELAHSFKTKDPILSLDIDGDEKYIAVGTTTGMLSLYERQEPKTKKPVKPTPTPQQKEKKQKTARADGVVVVEFSSHPPKLTKFDKLLFRFQYAEALDTAISIGEPEEVAAMVEEISNRGGIEVALRGRSDEQIVPILKFISKHFHVARTSKIFFSLYSYILDMYGPVLHRSPLTLKQIQEMKDQIEKEMEQQKVLFSLQGCLEHIFQTIS
eukprot:TRINITY_DN629_c1_g1_i1.p1 TRINITY_DN629_c1_g1~~TRINITY_DN629_c1_g1_i1.p1  ORF type:complete len:353 (-),score=87.65 TRINITY_DN629_c1_g1_i1:171-1229(-)